MGLIENLRSTVRFQELTLDPVARRLDRVANIEDLRRIAKRRLPGGVFDYIDGGAEDERALARSVEAFNEFDFRPRILRDVSQVDTSVDLFGRSLPVPLVLSPTGFTRIADSQGELAVAQAAARAGLPYSLSTLGTRSIEEVAAVSDGRLWFQVYVWKDRGLVREMVERAADSGYEAICITVDLATLGKRERDVRRGFTLPPKIGPGTIIDGLVHPGWTADFVRADPILFANVSSRADGSDGSADGTEAVALAQFTEEQLDPSLSWDDVEWFRSIWDGPILIKGVQDVDDARIASDLSIDAIALSNHGGRQLDSSPAPFDLIPRVREAIGDDMALLCDGGIRRGADVVKAVAMGATAAMTGRAYLYGLGAGGERGVDKALDILAAEVRRAMILIGATTTDELNPNCLQPAP